MRGSIECGGPSRVPWAGDPIHMVFVFSAPGFESFMRAESVPEGQPAPPLSKAQDASIQRRYSRAVIYRDQ